MDWELLRENRRNGKYVDFKICVEGQTFRVHKLVLQVSEYFETVFEQTVSERERSWCDQNDLSALGVKLTIDSLYGDDLVLDETSVIEVLQVCHKWRLHSSVKLCENFLLSHLAVHNCIITAKTATLYELDELANKCTTFILHHLAELECRQEIANLEASEINALSAVSALDEESVSPSALWSFYSRWGALQKDALKSELCKVLAAFPVSKFNIDVFKGVVWKNRHVKDCDECQQHVGRNMLDAVTTNHLSADNCLFVRQLSVSFKDQRVKKIVDRFIVQRHREVFPKPDFLLIEKRDLLNYAGSIQDKCSAQQFTVLLKWLRFEPGRTNAFPELFNDKPKKVMSSDSVSRERSFLSSIRSLKNNGKWIMSNSDCFYVKQLASEFECVELLKTIDSYIIQHFEEISKMPEFLKLDFDDVVKYITQPAIPPSLHWITRTRNINLWNAAVQWVHHDLQKRQQHFSALRNLLPLDQYPNDFMQHNFLKCGLLSDSEVSIMKIFLSREARMERYVIKLTEDMEMLQNELTKMKSEMAEITGRARRPNIEPHQESHLVQPSIMPRYPGQQVATPTSMQYGGYSWKPEKKLAQRPPKDSDSSP